MNVVVNFNWWNIRNFMPGVLACVPVAVKLSTLRYP